MENSWKHICPGRSSINVVTDRDMCSWCGQYRPHIKFKKGKIMTKAKNLDIKYITERPVQLQAVKITEENIIDVAEWVGALMVIWPVPKHAKLGERNQPWFTFGLKMEEATVGHWMVRDKYGKFHVTTQSNIDMAYICE